MSDLAKGVSVAHGLSMRCRLGEREQASAKTHSGDRPQFRSYSLRNCDSIPSTSSRAAIRSMSADIRSLQAW